MWMLGVVGTGRDLSCKRLSAFGMKTLTAVG